MTSVRRASRVSLGVKLATIAVVAAGGACTVWNGLSLDEQGASIADSGRDGATHPTGNDSAIGDDDDDATLPGSDGGPGDSAPTVEAAAPVTYLTTDQAAHACVLLELCPNLGPSLQRSLGLPLGDDNFSACMTVLAGAIPAARGGATPKSMMQCVASAASCTQAGECLPIEVISPTDTRCSDVHDDAGLGVCKDGEVYNCDPDYETEVFHCANAGFATGSTCTVSTSGQNVACATAKGCAGAYTCSGSVYQECIGINVSDYLTSSRNCTVSGEACGTTSQDAGAITDCLSEGNYLTCDSTMNEGAITCDPDAGVISACGDFYSMIFDCKTTGGTCVTTPSSAYCHRPTDDCAPTDTDVNTCNGSVLTVCLDGKKTTLDCASVGASCMSGGADAPSYCK